MKRYVLKVNDSIYVKSINWIIITLPVIKTGRFEDAYIFDESYLDEAIASNGYEKVVTRKELISEQYPAIEFVKVKVVIDEQNSRK